MYGASVRVMGVRQHIIGKRVEHVWCVLCVVSGCGCGWVGGVWYMDVRLVYEVIALFGAFMCGHVCVICVDWMCCVCDVM